MKAISRIYVGLILFFLYAPVAVMIFFSFNAGESVWVFTGLSTQWYKELPYNTEMLEALKHTLLVAVLSALISTVLGTAASVGILALRKKLSKRVAMSVTNIPLMNADIVTGISLMLLFIFFGKLFGLDESLGFLTVLIAHITFNLPYVILSVMPKLTQMDPNLQEAALDLGCKPVQAFFKVVIYEIMPGIISGALMAFAMSLDDFVISYFVYGPNFITLPVEIYNYTKKPLHPKLYALFTLLFLSILLVMTVMNILQAKDAKKNARARG